MLCACTKTDDQTHVAVITNLPSCPEGRIYNGVSCAEPITPAPEKDAGVAPPVAPPSTGGVDDARDTRPLSKTPRSAALVTVELQALESLANQTSPSSPDWGQLNRRIAETYFELYYAQPNPAQLKAAIRRYTDITAILPQYPMMDEVLYYLAYAYELSGDLMDARKTYFSLIQKYPSSKKIPYAYYAFGEMFFHEAKSDPTKWDLAVQAYKEALKFTDPLQAWAYLRLGQCEDARGDHTAAANYFAKLHAQYPQSNAAHQAP
jgi:TolA-binding protein